MKHKKQDAGELLLRAVLAVLFIIALAGCLQSASPGKQLAPATSVSSSTSLAAAPPASRTTPGPSAGHHPGHVRDNGTGNATKDNATAPLPPGPKPVWADPARADIYPGIYLSTSGAGCTTNFLFTSTDNRHLYLGSASHCFIQGGGIRCDATLQPDPPGTLVNFFAKNGTQQNWTLHPESFNDTKLNVSGVLVYNSDYLVLQQGYTDSANCPDTDFALVEIPLWAQNRTTPNFPGYGPVRRVANSTTDIHVGDSAYMYGHSPYWLGQEQLQEKRGVVTQKPFAPNYEFTLAAVAPPVFFGDSGSALIVGDGLAAGIASTFTGDSGLVHANGEFVYGPGNVLAFSLDNALAYMQKYTELRVKLAEP